MYLPPIMRDFHDCKRLFKRINEVVDKARERDKDELGSAYTENLPTWVMAHVYTVDFFLWFMARRGYTLQRSRKKLPYVDLEQDLRDFDERQLEEMRKFFEDEEGRWN
jgi:hypothetical protein